MTTVRKVTDNATPGASSPRLDALRTKLAATKLARDAAKEALTAEDREELELRRQLAAADEERRAEEAAKRAIDLDRREEAAREVHGPDAKISKLEIQGYEDSFILKAAPKAHALWEQQLQASVQNKKLDKADINRAYAVAAIIDWNGVTDFSMTSLNGHALIEFLKRNSGMVTPIVNEAAKLAGFFAEERKS